MPETPDPPLPGDVTRLLERMAGGDRDALEEIFPIVYDDLRRIARGQRRRGRSSLTLDTTALLHEAYLRFARGNAKAYEHRQHFFAVAARAMRHILLDEAKRRLRQKRGAGADHTDRDPEQLEVTQQAELMIALDQSLEKLGQIQERARQVVECRYFGGLTEEETARALDIDPRTVRRDWAKARAWLAEDLHLEA
ncbi:MAG: ECF-type sigma factor [Holophagales bacterium]|nr:ECF-type sigma factor [Holophagales bacterium]